MFQVTPMLSHSIYVSVIFACHPHSATITWGAVFQGVIAAPHRESIQARIGEKNHGFRWEKIRIHIYIYIILYYIIYIYYIYIYISGVKLESQIFRPYIIICFSYIMVSPHVPMIPFLFHPVFFRRWWRHRAPRMFDGLHDVWFLDPRELLSSSEVWPRWAMQRPKEATLRGAPGRMAWAGRAENFRWPNGHPLGATTRPGKHTTSYWTWPFIVDLPIKNCDFPLLC